MNSCFLKEILAGLQILSMSRKVTRIQMGGLQILSMSQKVTREASKSLVEPSDAARVGHLHVRRIRSRNLQVMQHEPNSYFQCIQMGGQHILYYSTYTKKEASKSLV